MINTSVDSLISASPELLIKPFESTWGWLIDELLLNLFFITFILVNINFFFLLCLSLWLLLYWRLHKHRALVGGLSAFVSMHLVILGRGLDLHVHWLLHLLLRNVSWLRWVLQLAMSRSHILNWLILLRGVLIGMLILNVLNLLLLLFNSKLILIALIRLVYRALNLYI